MNLKQKQWSAQLQEDNNAVILDVRTPEEYGKGYIPGAVNIDIYLGQGFLDEIRKLNTSKNYYVYCKAGGRSAQACSVMKQLGFNNAYNLKGGYSRWKGEVTR